MNSVPAGMTPGIIDNLRRTRPWVMLIAVLLFLSALLMVLAAAAMMFGMLAAMGGDNPFGAAAGVGVGIVYLISAAIYILLGVYLFKYSGAISRAVESGSGVDVEDALNQQRKFWLVAGIMAVIFIAFMILGIIAAVLIPMIGMG